MPPKSLQAKLIASQAKVKALQAQVKTLQRAKAKAKAKAKPIPKKTCVFCHKLFVVGSTFVSSLKG